MIFIIGLFCLLATLGSLAKIVTGRWFDDNYVSGFVTKGFSLIFQIASPIIATFLVYIVFSFIQNP